MPTIAYRYTRDEERAFKERVLGARVMAASKPATDAYPSHWKPTRRVEVEASTAGSGEERDAPAPGPSDGAYPSSWAPSVRASNRAGGRRARIIVAGD